MFSSFFKKKIKLKEFSDKELSMSPLEKRDERDLYLCGEFLGHHFEKGGRVIIKGVQNKDVRIIVVGDYKEKISQRLLKDINNLLKVMSMTLVIDMYRLKSFLYKENFKLTLSIWDNVEYFNHTNLNLIKDKLIAENRHLDKNLNSILPLKNI